MAGSRAKANDICWQGFWRVQVRPAVLLEQFQRKFKLVMERQQVLDCVRDRRLVSDYVLHCPGVVARLDVAAATTFSLRVLKPPDLVEEGIQCLRKQCARQVHLAAPRTIRAALHSTLLLKRRSPIRRPIARLRSFSHRHCFLSDCPRVSR